MLLSTSSSDERPLKYLTSIMITAFSKESSTSGSASFSRGQKDIQEGHTPVLRLSKTVISVGYTHFLRICPIPLSKGR
jgi:hypothetical protein